ncbi:hypothetical protein [Kangiella sp.]|uniref:hypothetical protein n=1 Tax=Kangiella sp. TaxID=1920245 RepID=UPI00198899AA|nr:hypothetical protein [Kangiella sp.]MBD3653169.1 hypothetical protein [Kangiella sp.]
MKKIMATLLVFLGLANMAGAVEKKDQRGQAANNDVAAVDLAWELAPVKSYNELINMAAKESPLDALSPAAKQRFIDSVVFTEEGVAGFYYKDLELELTPSEIHKILSLIGAQHMTSAFKKARVETKADYSILYSKDPKSPDGNFLLDYYCYQRASCEESTGKACTKNC